MDTAGYRKLGMALLVLAVGVAIVAIKGDVSSNLVLLLTTVFGTYSATNVAAKMAYKPAKEASSVPSVDASLTPALEEIKTQNNAIRNAIALTQQAMGQSLQHTATIISKAGFDKQ